MSGAACDVLFQSIFIVLKYRRKNRAPDEMRTFRPAPSANDSGLSGCHILAIEPFRVLFCWFGLSCLCEKRHSL